MQSRTRYRNLTNINGLVFINETKKCIQTVGLLYIYVHDHLCVI